MEYIKSALPKHRVRDLRLLRGILTILQLDLLEKNPLQRVFKHIIADFSEP
jgi:hypothetical protein